MDYISVRPKADE